MFSTKWAFTKLQRIITIQKHQEKKEHNQFKSIYQFDYTQITAENYTSQFLVRQTIMTEQILPSHRQHTNAHVQCVRTDSLNSPL